MSEIHDFYAVKISVLERGEVAECLKMVVNFSIVDL